MFLTSGGSLLSRLFAHSFALFEDAKSDQFRQFLTNWYMESPQEDDESSMGTDEEEEHSSDMDVKE